MCNTERLQVSVKHGRGSVTVQGCISASGEGALPRNDGIMNTEKYFQILINFNQLIWNLIGNSFIFQHNEPKDTPTAEKAQLDGLVSVMDQSLLDFSIFCVEWDHLDRAKGR